LKKADLTAPDGRRLAGRQPGDHSFRTDHSFFHSIRCLIINQITSSLSFRCCCLEGNNDGPSLNSSTDIQFIHPLVHSFSRFIQIHSKKERKKEKQEGKKGRDGREDGPVRTPLSLSLSLMRERPFNPTTFHLSRFIHSLSEEDSVWPVFPSA